MAVIVSGQVQHGLLTANDKQLIPSRSGSKFSVPPCPINCTKSACHL